MTYNIKRNSAVVAAIQPDGKLSRKLMAEEIVDMAFSLPDFIAFQIGDSVEVFGNTYYLATEPAVEKVSTLEFRFQLQFTGIKYRLDEVQLLQLDTQNQLTEPEFNLMCDASAAIDLLLLNANRLQSGWKKGVIDPTETKNISFNAENCLTALAKIATEFNLEFWVDGDKSIHLTKRSPISGYTLEYGRAKGLRGCSRTPLDGSNIVTRLYAVGSDKNLPKGYPYSKLRMDVPYLEKNKDRYDVIEHIENFPEIFPRRTGTVTEVDSSNPLVFTDATMDFDLNEKSGTDTKWLIAGTPVKLVFQTGQLAGYALEVEERGYNTAAKSFKLKKNEDEKALDIPNGLMRPAVGDKYIMEDIRMPDSYVSAAKAELKQKAQEYLEQNSLQRFQYGGKADAIYFKNQNVRLTLGALVHLKDADFALEADIRVIAISQNLQNEYDVDFELADTAAVTAITRDYFQQQSQQQVIREGIKFNAKAARAAYLYAQEFAENVTDSEGYYKPEKIKPLSIETKMISLGSRMQQFSLPDVAFFIENNSALRNTAGRLVHLTIADQPRNWTIAANILNGISAKFNNIYVKAQKTGNNASFVVTEEAMILDADPDFYYFEVGYLSSIIDGVRRIKTTYGFAQLNPAELSIGRISDPSGNNYIDLLPDKININAKVTFSAGSSGYDNISDKPDLDALKSAAISASQAYAAAQDALAITTANAHADGVVTAAEQRAIADATAKADAAKTYAAAQDNLLRVELQSWADGQISDSEAAQIAAAQQALVDAKAYSDAQDNLAKIAAAAYADGIVDDAEAAAIADATAKMEAAKAHAQTLVNNVQIGGRNLLKANYETSEQLIAGETYTLSFQIKSPSSPGYKYPHLWRRGQSWGSDAFNGWEVNTRVDKVVITFVCPITDFYYFVMEAENQNYSYSQKPKLEKGNKATDWTPAPEDVQSQIDANAANISTNTALTAANASLIGQLNQKTDWISPTVDPNINAIMAGTLAVGNSYQGVTGVLSGKNDNGGESLRLGLGIFAPGLFVTELRDNGRLISRHAQGTVERFGGVDTYRDNNGRIRRQVGWTDGAPVDRRYSANGTLLYEDTVYGPVVYAIGESWSENLFFKTSNSDINASDTTLQNEIKTNVTKTGGKKIYKNENGLDDFYWEYTLRLNSNYTAYFYNAGNVDANNLQYVGYKTTTGQKTNSYNAQNGWYVRNVGDLATEIVSGPGAIVETYVDCVYILDGKIKNSKSIQITK